MTLTSYEREDTFELTHTFYSGSVAAYPLSANLTIYKPDGAVLMQDASGIKTGTTGQYRYYVSTNSTSDLGIYKSKWYGKIYYGDKWGYLPEVDCDSFIITTIA